MEAPHPGDFSQEEIKAVIRRCLRDRHQIDRPTSECLCRLSPELHQVLSRFEETGHDNCVKRIRDLMACRCQAVTEGELTTFDDQTLDQIAQTLCIELDRTLAATSMTTAGEPAHWFG
ncbi:MAG: hypothetical protein R3236_01660 [Phycisphaeraceae bacterium]|nr:hypothetical protein [Phycisphaeraceae bacterium]